VCYQVVAGGGRGALRVVRCMAASDAAQLKSAREDIKQLLKTTYCHPIMVRITAPCFHYAVLSRLDYYTFSLRITE
jgi:hypothetical protein